MKKMLLVCCLIAPVAIAQPQKTAPVRLPAPDSRAPNDCLPAAMRVYHELPGPPTCNWKRILSARYADGRRHHVYCVFSLGSHIYAYDNSFGSRRVFPVDKTSAAVVRAVDFQAASGIYLDQSDRPATRETEKGTYLAGSPAKRKTGQQVATSSKTSKKRN